jgi:hypothetical protein
VGRQAFGAPGVRANPTTAIGLAQERYQRRLEKFPGLRSRASSPRLTARKSERLAKLTAMICSAYLIFFRHVLVGTPSPDSPRPEPAPAAFLESGNGKLAAGHILIQRADPLCVRPSVVPLRPWALRRAKSNPRSGRHPGGTPPGALSDPDKSGLMRLATGWSACGKAVDILGPRDGAGDQVGNHHSRPPVMLLPWKRGRDGYPGTP